MANVAHVANHELGLDSQNTSDTPHEIKEFTIV
jgi:hypothetical protein